jgi:DNA-binding transcriptional LysR family regulator
LHKIHKSNILIPIVHEFLATTPFDIYELSLFHLVIKHGSFTKAAAAAGLTQSAVTRQIQGIEKSLGVSLVERTTRRVRPTPAGEFLFLESSRLLSGVENSLRRLREEFAGARKEIRVGVSRTIGLAYLPGFFHANLRRLPDLACRVSYKSSRDIITDLDGRDLDVGVVCAPERLPRHLRVTHRFKDAFVLIAPASLSSDFAAAPKGKRQAWLQQQNWLLIDRQTNTGEMLHHWMRDQRLSVEPVMQLDSFDLIINLVALGMGLSFVPIRSLALYGRKRNLARLQLPGRFVRELVVIVRHDRNPPAHFSAFVQNILF